MTDLAGSDRHFGWNSARWEKKSVTEGGQDLILFFTVVKSTYSSRKITAQLDLLSKKHLHSILRQLGCIRWLRYCVHPVVTTRVSIRPHISWFHFFLIGKASFPCLASGCVMAHCVCEKLPDVFTAGREGHWMSFHYKKIMNGRRAQESFQAREKVCTKWLKWLEPAVDV